MSAQTGVDTPRGPASRRLGDRVKYRFARWRAEPNPLWMREMRQAARLIRTPVILMALTVFITLFMGALGGLVSGGTRSPAAAGSILFQVFFSVAYFVVALVGPALGANGIASEREGKTWEAVLLTGMCPELVTRGKFQSAYTAIAMYVVMLAPVGALPFLFGGVTPFEVLLAFVYLFLFALLGVAFGLAISAKMESLRVALLVTLLAAVPISVFCFTTFGVLGSVVAHERWSTIPDGPPVWLPTAYGRVPFGLEYLVFLVALPITIVGLPAWLLYEITRSNLTSVTEDRTIGLKRWYIWACVLLLATSFIPLFAGSSPKIADRHIGGMCIYCVFIVFSAFLFAGEEIGPSRRVMRMLAGKGAWRRFLSPGVVPTARLLLIGSIVPLVLLTLGGIAFVLAQSPLRRDEQIAQLVVFSSYALGFALFVIGLMAALRARARALGAPRVLSLVTLFLLTVGPWGLAAMAGVMTSGDDRALAVAAPSPIYALVVALKTIGRVGTRNVAVLASSVTGVAYGALGVLFTRVAVRECRAIIDRHEARLAEADSRLAAEDAAEQALRQAAYEAGLVAVASPGDDEGAPAARRVASADPRDRRSEPPAANPEGSSS